LTAVRRGTDPLDNARSSTPHNPFLILTSALGIVLEKRMGGRSQLTMYVGPFSHGSPSREAVGTRPG